MVADICYHLEVGTNSAIFTLLFFLMLLWGNKSWKRLVLYIKIPIKSQKNTSKTSAGIQMNNHTSTLMTSYPDHTFTPPPSTTANIAYRYIGTLRSTTRKLHTLNHTPYMQYLLQYKCLHCISLWFRARICTLHAMCFGLNNYIRTCAEVDFFAGFEIYAKN